MLRRNYDLDVATGHRAAESLGIVRVESAPDSRLLESRGSKSETREYARRVRFDEVSTVAQGEVVTYITNTASPINGYSEVRQEMINPGTGQLRPIIDRSSEQNIISSQRPTGQNINSATAYSYDPLANKVQALSQPVSESTQVTGNKVTDAGSIEVNSDPSSAAIPTDPRPQEELPNDGCETFTDDEEVVHHWNGTDWEVLL